MGDPLIQACLKGSPGAWNLFIEEYSRLIYWCIHRVLVKYKLPDQEALVKEIFQDVFQRLSDPSELARLLEVKNIKLYLSAVAAHSSIDYMKSRLRYEKRYAPLEVQDPDSLTAPDALRPVFESDIRQVLEHFLSSLPGRDRLCLELFYLEKHSHAEIADILNVPLDTASSAIRRAREKLKALLKEKGIDQKDLD